MRRVNGEWGKTMNLVERCRELLEWSATGLLNGGSGGAVRALADELREKFGDTYALSIAESQTKDDAMRAVISLTAENERLKRALEQFSDAYEAQDSDNFTQELNEAHRVAHEILMKL